MQAVPEICVKQENHTEEDVSKSEVLETCVFSSASTEKPDATEEGCPSHTSKPFQLRRDENEVPSVLSGHCVHSGSTVRRVSSLPDLLKFKQRRKSCPKVCKSEESISSLEYVLSHDVLRSAAPESSVKGLNSLNKSDKTQVGEENGRTDFNQGHKRMLEDEIQTDQEDQCSDCFVASGITAGLRRRSLSDYVSSKSPSTLIVAELRKTKSYTLFPHIDTQLQIRDTVTPSVHRTSCFRLMPHLSESSFPDPGYSTVTVLSLSEQFENSPPNLTFEISSDSEDSGREQNNTKETVLHSWRRASNRPRSHSEPIFIETEDRARTWSLPEMEKKSSRVTETMHKVKVSPSRLRFPENTLERLKEELSSPSLAKSIHSSLAVASSSVMSAVDDCEGRSRGSIVYLEAVSGAGEEVTGHWMNRKRTQSIAKPTSVSLLKEIDEKNTEVEVESDLHKTPAGSLVNQVTEQVLSCHDVDVLSEVDDQFPTVEAAVRLWQAKESRRRTTLASGSPLTDCSKYASEIEQHAFRKIKKWKESFALKLDNVLGERFQEIASKREEEINRNKKPKVLKVPMNLSDKEMGQLKNNLLLELKRKSIAVDDRASLPTGDSFSPPPPPIPRVKFSKKPPSEHNPADLRAQMMKELTRRVSCLPNDDETLHCYKPSAIVPDMSTTSVQVKPQQVVYVPGANTSKTLDPSSVRDLLSWHEAERKRLKAELEKLPQAEQVEGQQLLIDKEDVHKVLRSMMKIMEDIFTGTMNRFMGSGGLAPHAEVNQSIEKGSKRVAMTSGESAEIANSQFVQTGGEKKKMKLDSTAPELSDSEDNISSSKETGAEVMSSESSLTGISFTSSSEAFDVPDVLPEPDSANNHVIIMSSSSDTSAPQSPSLEQNLAGVFREDVKTSDPVVQLRYGSESEEKGNTDKDVKRVKSVESVITREGRHEKLNNKKYIPAANSSITLIPLEETTVHSKYNSEGHKKEIPEEAVKRTDSSFESSEANRKNEIQQLRQALCDQTETENLLKHRFESLQNDFNGAAKNSDHWFNEYVKEREKNNELQISVRNLESFNEELCQQIEKSSNIIHEKDSEIEAIRKSKTETEKLLQEVKTQLFQANDETKHLKTIVRQYEEGKLHSFLLPHPVQLDNTSKQMSTFNENSQNTKNLMDNENGKFESLRKGKEDKIKNIASCSDAKGDICNASDLSLNTDKGEIENSQVPSKTNTDFGMSDVAVKSGAPNAVECDGSTLMSVPYKSSHCALGGKNNIKQTAITKWLSDIIRQAKTKLARESLPSFSEKSGNGPYQMLTCSTGAVKNSFKDTKTTLSGKFSRNMKTKYWHRYMKVFNAKRTALTNSHGMDKGQQRVDRNQLTSVTFDSTIPFADVFLAHFEYVDFSLTDSLVSLEPFGDCFLPWIRNEDIGSEQLVPDPQLKRKDTETTPTNKAQANLNGKKQKTAPREQTMTEKPGVTVQGLEKIVPERKETHYIDSKHLILEENQGNSPTTENSYGTRQGNTQDLVVSPENGLKRLIADLRRSLTRSCDQPRSTEKHFQLKQEDSTVLPSTSYKALSPNNHAFVKSLSVQVSMNAKELMKHLESQGLFNSRGAKGHDKILNLTMTSRDRFKELSPERVKRQKEQNLCSMFEEIKGPCLRSPRTEQDMSNNNLSFGETKITKRADVTKLSLAHLLKDTHGAQKEDVVIRKATETLHETLREASASGKKKFISIYQNEGRSNLSQGKSLKNESKERGDLETKRVATDVLSVLDGKQKLNKKYIRAAKRREKNDCLRNNPKGKFIDGKHSEDGLILSTGDGETSKPSSHLKDTGPHDVSYVHNRKDDLKFSGWLKSSKMAKESEGYLKPKQKLLSREMNPLNLAGVLDKEIMHQSQATLNLDSTKKEKDLDRLLKICNSTQDVLRRQEEQQKEIQNCKNKIHFMTQELETMQTKTKRENSLDKEPRTTVKHLVSPIL